MARYVHYRCPECQGVFRWLQHPSDAPPPDRCSLCRAWVSTAEPPEEVFVPQAPRIRENAYAQSIDRVYRAEEQASAARAEDAVAALEDVYRSQPREDGPESEMVAHAQKLELMGLRSGIKITDMKDPTSMREGDTSAVAATPTGLAQAGGKAQFQNLGGVVPNYAPGMPMTGEPTRQVLTNDHAARAQVMTAQGQVGSFFDRS